MGINNILPISEARGKIFDLARQVQKPGIYYTLTERGRPKAVLMSAEEFESWQETLEVMKEFPEIDKDIKKAEGEYKKGKYITLEEWLGQEGYILRNKSKKKYGVLSRHAKKVQKELNKIPQNFHKKIIISTVFLSKDPYLSKKLFGPIG